MATRRLPWLNIAALAAVAAAAALIFAGNVQSKAPTRYISESVVTGFILAEVSQLPVLQGGQLVGVVDESDLLFNVHADAAHFHKLVSTAMSAAPQTLAPSASLAELQAVLDRGLTAIVADASGFHGLITRFDLLNHLRRSLT